MKYKDLPYLPQEALPSCEYAKAGALRIPLRDAVNSARMMPDRSMDQVVAILETVLAHIKQEVKDAPAPKKARDTRIVDPLDELLGPDAG